MSAVEAVLRFLKILLKLLFINVDSDSRPFVLFFILQLIYIDFKAINLIASNIKEVSDVVEALMPTVVTLLSTVKLLNLAMNQHALKNLFQNISETLPKGCDDIQIEILKRAATLSYLLVRFLAFGLAVFNIFYMISQSFLDANGVQLPMPMFVHLIPGEGNILFVVNFIYDVTVILLNTVSTIAADALDVLLDKINKFSKDEVASEKLHDVWQYHLIVLGLKNSLQRMFQMHISVQYLTSIGILCFSAYGMTEKTVLPMTILVLLALMEIFSICYLGQRIENKSDTILNQLYSLPWVEFSRLDARRLLFMMMTSRAALTITTPFATLTLQTFSQVLKTTYSLYTLLHQVT